jgi:hypothetical protein
MLLNIAVTISLFLDDMTRHTNAGEMCTVCFLMLYVSSTYTQLSAFRIARASNGSAWCAVDQSTISVSVDQIYGLSAPVPNAVKCAYYCTEFLSRTSGCKGFNQLVNGRCQFYATPSSTCAFTGNCTYYQVSESLEQFSLRRIVCFLSRHIIGLFS